MLELPYQRVGASFLANTAKAALFDEPGMGKTCQAIMAVDLLGLERIVTVCPASVRDVWPAEIRKFSKNPRRVIKARSIDDLNLWLRGRADWLVCSYEHATAWEKQLSKDLRDATILDELHMTKSWHAKRTRAAFGHNCSGDFGY